MLTVTKRFEFAYAHFLPEYDGNCRSLHGHNGVLEVEVSDSPGSEVVYPTMVCDFGVLKKIVKENVIDVLDHTDLNLIFKHPTAETMTRWIWEQLEIAFGESLVRVRVYETSDSYAEFKGE